MSAPSAPAVSREAAYMQAAANLALELATGGREGLVAAVAEGLRRGRTAREAIELAAEAPPA